jgi:hypothetical protein
MMRFFSSILITGIFFSLLSTGPAEGKGPAENGVLRLRSPGVTSVDQLLKGYRSNPHRVMDSERLRFTGVGQHDVYNPTKPFVIGHKTIIAARVESRASELDSNIVFFEKRGRTWHPVKDAPRMALQDPFVTKIHGELVIGGVEVKEKPNGGTAYRTVFYRGTALSDLERFAEGPPKMKDIRLAELDDGRIFVLTRPQGKKGGRGKIGYTIIHRLSDLGPKILASAPLIRKQFSDQEWGGANEIIPLGASKLGVLGHIAKADTQGERHYYPVSFVIDLAQKKVSPCKLLLERKDLPQGLHGPAKRPDIKDVLFSGGLQRHFDHTATLYVGGGDAAIYKALLRDPFADGQK